MDMYSLHAACSRNAAKIACGLFTALCGDKGRTAVMRAKQSRSPRLTVTAHSGALATRDNTLYSVKTILKIRVDILEMDVTFRPDGTPVIIHAEAPGENSGTELTTALDAVDRNSTIRLNLDLKSFNTRFLPELQRLLGEHSLLSRSFFTGVTEEYISAVAESCPAVPYYLNCEINSGEDPERAAADMAEKIKSLGALGANISYKYSSRALSDALHSRGLEMSVWTVNRFPLMLRVISDGADNITSRVPLRLMRLLEKID